MSVHKCMCGATFSNGPALGGHMLHCTTFLIHKYGSIETYNKIQQDRKEQTEKRKQEQLEKWINEQHTCKKCGKIMTVKWGSGKFCSRSCANSRTKTPEVIENIKQGMKSSTKFSAAIHRSNLEYQKRRFVDILMYAVNPNYCECCNKPLNYDSRNLKTCSKECEQEWHRIFRSNYIEENGINSFAKKGYKYGWYKGYHCDSSWELAFLMYHLDHNIPIERNKKNFFQYTYEGSIHRFFPDFIVDETFIEIKGMESDQCDCKVRDMPQGVKFKILYYNDMKPYLQYAEETYGKNFYENYDKNLPSWLDSLKQ